MDAPAQKGWLMLLSYSEDSNWGAVEDFYSGLDTSDDEFIDIESPVWGKLNRKNLKPEVGDGLAFYHTTRAKFGKNDPHARRARISLIGTILEVTQSGQEVTWLSVRIRRADLEFLRMRPIIRNADTEYLFQQCGMVRGSVNTFYEALQPVWSEFLARAAITTSNSLFDGYLEEFLPEFAYFEGAVKTIKVNAYERNVKARSQCIDHWGVQCVGCGFDFEQRYGQIGKGFIHVHHLKPLAEIGAEYIVNPIEDLRPICPNCHAIIHRRNPALSIEELIDLITQPVLR